jgi:hypothetical protein
MAPNTYPVSHFQLMSAIAAQLAIRSIQLLEHSYTYQHFDSWWFTFRNSKGTFRISFDGRDRFLSLEAGEESPDRLWITSWKYQSSEQLKDPLNSEATIEIVNSLVEKAC